MSDLATFMIGQLAAKVDRIGVKLDAVSEQLEAATSWAKRVVQLGVALIGAIALNLEPDKIGAILAQAIRSLK